MLRYFENVPVSRSFSTIHMKRQGSKNQRKCVKNETEMPTNFAIKLNAQNLFAKDNHENCAGKNEISLTYFTFPVTIHTSCFILIHFPLNNNALKKETKVFFLVLFSFLFL